MKVKLSHPTIGDAEEQLKEPNKGKKSSNKIDDIFKLTAKKAKSSKQAKKISKEQKIERKLKKQWKKEAKDRKKGENDEQLG